MQCRNMPPIYAFMQLHPFCQQKPIVEYCRKHAIVVQAYCPILRGKLDHEVIQEIAKKERVLVSSDTHVVNGVFSMLGIRLRF